MTESTKRAVPALLGGLPLVLLALAWTVDDGGYAPTAWYPGALLLLGLSAAALLGLGRHRRRLTRPVGLAVAAIAAYAVWSYASILWADVPGDALDGANRTLVYALAFSLGALLPWEPRSASIALLAYGLGLGAVGVGTLATVVGAEDPTPHLIDARLAAPLGYPSGSAALWAILSGTTLVLAARRQTPLLLRPLCLAAAALGVDLALLTQSRGWLYLLPVAWLAVLALTGQRLRFVAATALVALAALWASPDLLAVYDEGGFSADDTRSPAQAAADIAEAFDGVVGPIVTSLAALLIVGGLLALLDDRARPTTRSARIGSRVGLALAGVLAAAAVAGGLAATDGQPVDKVQSAWQDFKGNAAPPGEGGSRLSSFSSGRYDFWRVALDGWEGNPVGGLGQDNFVRLYLRERRTGEEPRWVHSLPLRLLGHTGLVGFLLFAAFAVLALVAALRARRALAVRGGRSLAAAALAPAAVWVVHGSIDWLWEYPALSVPALAFAGLATALRAPTGGGGSVAWVAPKPRVPAWAGRVVVIAGALVAVVLLAPPWLAARERRDALATFRAEPAGALAALDRAASLAPLSAEPLVTEGLVALRVAGRDRATAAYEEALERDPGNWFAEFQLALIASEAGDRRTARARLRRCLELKKDDDVLAEAYERAAGPRPMTIAEADRKLLQQVQEVTAR